MNNFAGLAFVSIWKYFFGRGSVCPTQVFLTRQYHDFI